ncbi:MAG: discoidin domain-containing protein [Acidobacteria bacterium]|nr:discoidin domain-containing protein [Acidobacteriota bacterium]
MPVNQPPKVALLEPAPGLTFPKGTPINVTAQVQDDGAISKVEFFYNLRGTTTKFATVTAPASDGKFHATLTAPEPDTYGIFAVATDAGNLRGQSETVGVYVRNSLPQVSWVAPANGSSFVMPSSVTLTARATDSDGTISKVEFYSSNLGLVGSDATADAGGNYSVEFANPAAGTHEINAWATDDNGSRAAATITITINAQATPTPTPVPTPTPTPTPTLKVVNVALGRAAAQSSTLSGGSPSRAVDGNNAGDWSLGSVTLTGADAQAWWQLDIGSIQSLQSIKIWNRTDCCGERLSDFYVLVSDEPFASTSLASTLSQTGVFAYHFTGTAGSVASIPVYRTGRYVRVQLVGTNNLSLAEVAVFATGRSGKSPIGKSPGKK